MLSECWNLEPPSESLSRRAGNESNMNLSVRSEEKETNTRVHVGLTGLVSVCL